jgi:hypothetical protein
MATQKKNLAALAEAFGHEPYEILVALVREAKRRSKTGDHDWRDMWENVHDHLAGAVDAILNSETAHDAPEGE